MTKAKPDQHCLICGYDLRGGAAEATCPECGAVPLPESGGNLLATAPRHYLARLQFGFMLLEVAGLLYIFYLLYWAVQFSSIGMTGSPVPASEPESAFIYTAAVVVAIGAWVGQIALVPSLLILVGTWLMTAADPRFRTPDRFWRLRLWVRAGVILFLVVQAHEWLAPMARANFNPAQPGVGRIVWDVVDHAGWIAALCAFAAAIVLYLCGPAYLKRLALRAGDEAMSRFVRHHYWLIPTCAAAIIASDYALRPLAVLFNTDENGIAYLLQAGRMVLLAAVVLWFGVWTLHRCRRMIRRSIP